MSYKKLLSVVWELVLKKERSSHFYFLSFTHYIFHLICALYMTFKKLSAAVCFSLLLPIAVPRDTFYFGGFFFYTVLQLPFPFLYTIHIFPCKDILNKISQ